jgi:hypothetical protein
MTPRRLSFRAPVMVAPARRDRAPLLAACLVIGAWAALVGVFFVVAAFREMVR